MARYSETALVRGLHFLGEAQAAIANNLANLETASYKRRSPVAGTSATFQRVLDQRLPTVRYGEVADFQPGTVRQTDNPMEVALTEGAFLRVQDGKGRTYLTRDGQMSIDAQGRLVTHEGLRYLDVNGNPIQLGLGEESPTSLTIAPNGQISDAQRGTAYGQLGMFRVPDVHKLVPVGSGNYEDLGKQKLEPAQSGLQQGYQEGSNVDSLQELVQMIVVQRSFSATQKALGSVGRMQDNLVANLNR